MISFAQSNACPKPQKDDKGNSEESESAHPGEAPPEFEDGGQATLDELQEPWFK